MLKDKEISDIEKKIDDVLFQARATQTELNASVAGDKSGGTLDKLVKIKMSLDEKLKEKVEKKKEIDFWYSIDRFD